MSRFFKNRFRVAVGIVIVSLSLCSLHSCDDTQKQSTEVKQTSGNKVTQTTTVKDTTHKGDQIPPPK